MFPNFALLLFLVVGFFFVFMIHPPLFARIWSWDIGKMKNGLAGIQHRCICTHDSLRRKTPAHERHPINRDLISDANGKVARHMATGGGKGRFSMDWSSGGFLSENLPVSLAVRLCSLTTRTWQNALKA